MDLLARLSTGSIPSGPARGPLEYKESSDLSEGPFHTVHGFSMDRSLSKGKLTDFTYSKGCKMKKGPPPSKGPRRTEDQPMESLGKELGSTGTAGFART